MKISKLVTTVAVATLLAAPAATFAHAAEIDSPAPLTPATSISEDRGVTDTETQPKSDVINVIYVNTAGEEVGRGAMPKDSFKVVTPDCEESPNCNYVASDTIKVVVKKSIPAVMIDPDSVILQSYVKYVDSKGKEIGRQAIKAKKGDHVKLVLPECSDVEGCSYVTNIESVEASGHDVTVVLQKQIPATKIDAQLIYQMTSVKYMYEGNVVKTEKIKAHPGEELRLVTPACLVSEGCEFFIPEEFSTLTADGKEHEINLGLKSAEATPEATPEATTPEVTPEATPEVTPEVTPEDEDCSCDTPEATPEVTPEATPEVTPEVTPEATPEVTPEVTPEATPEVTPEVTPQDDNKIHKTMPNDDNTIYKKTGASNDYLTSALGVSLATVIAGAASVALLKRKSDNIL